MEGGVEAEPEKSLNLTKRDGLLYKGNERLDLHVLFPTGANLLAASKACINWLASRPELLPSSSPSPVPVPPNGFKLPEPTYLCIWLAAQRATPAEKHPSSSPLSLVPNARAANPDLYPNGSAPKQSFLFCSPAPIHGPETGYLSSFIRPDPSTGNLF